MCPCICAHHSIPFCFFTRRLRDAEAVSSRVSHDWSQQRLTLSSEQRRQMRIRHSPIIDQVILSSLMFCRRSSCFETRYIASWLTEAQVQNICIVTRHQTAQPELGRHSVPPLFDSCKLAPSSIEAISSLRTAHMKWLQERGVIVAEAPTACAVRP